MKKRIFFVIVNLLIFGALASAQDLYVSISGSDDNPGTVDSPLATAAKALEIAGSGAAQDYTIWFANGLYHFDAGLKFNASHNGITLRAMVGENVIFSGGKAVGGHLFKQVTDAVELNRIPPLARGKVFVAVLPDELAGTFPTKDKYDQTGEVTWNGYRLNIAQYPNKGFGYMGEVLDPGPSNKTLPFSEEKPIGGVFKMQDELDWTMLANEFLRTKDMIVHGYINNDWKYEVHRVGAIDESNETIKLLRWTSYIVGNDHINTPRRVGIRGALCQLDQPGEWYFDRAEKKLYIWPIQPMNSQNPITILNDLRFFSGENVEDITIRDITFQNFGELALYFKGSNNLTVAGCTFRSSAGMGIRMGEGVNNRILSNDFYNMHQAFVMSGLTANRRNLVDENNKANNNHIHNMSFKGYGLAAILGVGGEFKNNLLHDMNGAFKFANANDINIEYNEFYNMGYEMGDWNVIYSNDDYATRGNYIKHNFFHHMMEVPGSHGLAAVRQDGEATGYHVESNIMYKTGRAACQVMGADNSVSKNVVMGGTQYVWYTRQAPYDKTDKSEWITKSAHLAAWKAQQDQLQEDIANGVKSSNDIENRLGQAEEVFGIQGWKVNELWKSRYPNLAEFSVYTPEGSPYTNAHTMVMDNYVDNGGEFPYHFHGGNTVSTIADANLMLPSTSAIDEGESFSPAEMFNNPDEFDYTFKASFVAKDDFEKWNFDSVGLYVDDYRRTMPIKPIYRNAIKDKYDGIRPTGGSFNKQIQNDRYSEPEYLKLQHDIAVLESKPVLYFPFNESAGPKAIDQQAGVEAIWQNGDATHLTWQNAKFYNGATMLGGVDEYFTFSSEAFNNADALSLSLWVKTDARQPGVLFSGSGITLSLDGLAPKLTIGSRSLTSNKSFVAGTWNHLVMIWDQSGIAKIYLDGQELGTIADAPTTLAVTSVWAIGGQVGQDATFSGSIDDVSLFDCALTQEEIELLYMTGEQGIATSTLIPVNVTGIQLDINRLILRDANSGRLSSVVFPSHAANQNVLWHSTDTAIVRINANGEFFTRDFGTAAVVATTVDGAFTDTCLFEVYEEVSAGLTAPVAYWPFDEIVGDTALDVIGGHHAVWQNTAEAQDWSDGLFARSATYHGSDQDRFVTVSDPLADCNAFTISVWFNLDATSQYEGIVTTRDLDTEHKSNNWGIAAERNHIDGRWDGQALDTDDAIYAGAWYNVVHVWKNDGTRQIYINGELKKSASDGATAYLTNNVWFIGDDVCCGGREIDGRIDELKMYDKALTSEEIQYLYELSKLGISYFDLTSKRPDSVTIEQEYVLMKVGEHATVSATVLPAEASNKVVFWSTLDASIATVDVAGVISGIGVGETQVVATSADGARTDTVTVQVLSNPVISITLSDDSLALMENKYYTLTADVLPVTATNKLFTWSTTDDKVLTIDATGVLRTHNEGEAFVIATSLDGGLADSCFVQVKAIHVVSVTLDQHMIDVSSRAFVNLTATVLPNNAKTPTLIWTSTDESVISNYGDGIFYALKQGTATLMATSLDGGLADSCVVNVDGGASAISKTLASEGIVLYPNPAQNQVFLSFESINGLQGVSIVNAFGQHMKELHVTCLEDNYDISGLASGYYLVRFFINDKVLTSRLVVVD